MINEKLLRVIREKEDFTDIAMKLAALEPEIFMRMYNLTQNKDDIAKEVIRLIEANGGTKLPALKYYRKFACVSLRHAKAYVDDTWANYQLRNL